MTKYQVTILVLSLFFLMVVYLFSLHIADEQVVVEESGEMLSNYHALVLGSERFKWK